MSVPESAPVITIDGPSGVGKGTLTQSLAQSLGWHLLDSGALYRLTALRAADQGIDLADADAVAVCARALPVRFVSGEAGQPVRVEMDGEDVTQRLRTEECGHMASQVAVHPPVRQALLQRQRDFQQPPGLVADGRDMGTVVFPLAPLKIFLMASAEVRAQRRYDQLKRQGDSVKISHLLKEIEARDARDMNRSESPLRPAEDAVEIDTSGLTIQQVFDMVIKLWQDVKA